MGAWDVMTGTMTMTTGDDDEKSIAWLQSIARDAWTNQARRVFLQSIRSVRG